MSTYYSVIFASVNSIVSEQLTIGLLMSDGKKIWFRYSNAKLAFMRNFFESDAFQLLKTTLKNIEVVVSSHLKNNSNPDNLLFQAPVDTNPFSIEYLRYLSRYSNATMTFKEPVEIDVDATDKLFDHLYAEFVFTESEVVPIISEIETVKSKLQPRISKNVNWDYRVETGSIPGLIMPVELDFIGKNDQPVVGRITDFNQSNYHLDASLSNLFVLMKAFEMNNQSGKYFLIGDEPDKQNQKQHRTWQEVRNSTFLNYIPFNETNLVADYMESHEVVPYF